jgi:hypothetical protein
VRAQRKCAIPARERDDPPALVLSWTWLRRQDLMHPTLMLVLLGALPGACYGFVVQRGRF